MAEKLKESWSGMEDQVKEKTAELNEKMLELQSKTKDQDDTQRAMINLLEDAKELEEDIKKEKEGVEAKVEERTQELQEQAKALDEARKRATSGWMQLQEEKARLNASIEAIPFGLVILNSNHEVIGCNSGFKKMIGLSERTDLEPVVFEEFLSSVEVSVGETCPHCRNDHQLYVKDETSYKNRYLKIAVAPVIQGDEVIGGTYLIEDVTEAKTLQKTRDEFFSVASHELRTPLTAIRGNTQMLQDYYPEIQNNEEVKEMIGDVHSASVRLIGIVNEFFSINHL